MNSQEQQKKHDFVQDLKLLAEQYGYTLDSAMSMLGFKPKSAEDLALEYAQEAYKKGVVFIPVNKQKPRVSDGRVELHFGIYWCWDETGSMRKIKSEIGDWAQVINE
jgi:hypothetical protein